MLTCDARGVLPPISKLDTNQTMFHFISGYTSKMAGTEDGVTEPQATFSSCFAQPFLALHPMRYAKMLADKIAEHKANAWLLNTGWVGAGATTGGKRCPLKYTRAILDAIHSGELADAEFETYEVFNLKVPKTCKDVPDELLNPAKVSLQCNRVPSHANTFSHGPATPTSRRKSRNSARYAPRHSSIPTLIFAALPRKL